MEKHFNDITVTGNNNLVITQVNGSTITITISELFEKYENQLSEILSLLQEKDETAYNQLKADLEKYVYERKDWAYKLDVLLIKIRQGNQVSDTHQALLGKKVEELDKATLKRLWRMEKVKKQLSNAKLNAKSSIEEKLRTLFLMTNGDLIKGTFMCLCPLGSMNSVARNASYATFGLSDGIDKTTIVSVEHIGGNLIIQYEKLIELIKRSFGPLIAVDGIGREWDYEIPQTVFQELLANAFVHRIYEQTPHQTRIMVEMYADRIVIKNPGKFPSAINPNDLATLSPTIPINTEILSTFFWFGYIENYGSGLKKVFKTLSDRGYPRPEFTQENDEVVVTVYKKKRVWITNSINGLDTLKNEKNIPKHLNHIPLALPPKIIGRNQEVEKIRQLFTENNSLVIINGIGGIGKTVLAHHYWQVYQNNYTHLLWLKGDSNLDDALLYDYDLQQSLGVAEEMKSHLEAIRQPQNPDAKKQALAFLYKSLKNVAPKALMLIDNATDENHWTIKQWKMTFANFHILVTSRETFANVKNYQLACLSELETIELFYLYYDPENVLSHDDAIVLEIVQKAGYHTLTIELLAMTLKDSDELTLSTLLEKLNTALISNNKNILTDIPTLITLALTSIAMYAEALVKEISNNESKKLINWFKHILIDEEDKTTFAHYLKNPQNPEVKGELKGALKRVLKGNDTAIAELQALIKAIETQQS